ncbi:hypothetical protein [Candidatus Palauibacter sp.]|uniref:hypothetical protein n=1 Tax=Candidatus Palauibacter sp. TaxID=3101350 RepID=UPI003B5B1767
MAAKPTKTVRVGNLLLDPKNTRIPTAQQTDDQRALLHELVAHDKVWELAKSIASIGLFPTERMVVMPHGRKYIVLEGNRRLAAIKLLFTPELAQTSSDVRKYKRLARQMDLTPLTSIDVVVVENRLAAARIIAALHTKPARHSWKPGQKAQFYRDMVETGLTPQEVSEEIGVTEGEVRRSLRSEILYRIAQTFDDLPAAIQTGLNSRQFAFTTLERFLERTAGQEFLGIKPDNTHGIRGFVHPDRFRAVLTKIVTDIITLPGLTRQINTERDMREYAKKAEGDIPATETKGSFTPGSFLGDAEPKPEPATPPKSKRKRRRSTSVIPNDFECTVHEPKVSALFGELKNINVRTQRNSSGVMLRVLLDVALWCFYKSTKQDAAVIAHYDKNRHYRKRNSNWTPSLRQLLSFGIENHIFPGMTADEYKSLKTLLARDANWSATIDVLNEYTHNPQVQPTTQEVHAVWERAQPLLKIILK